MKDRNRQREAHLGLTNSLPEDLVEDWESLCVAWERAPYPKERAVDGSKLVNPFTIQRECKFLCEHLTWLANCSDISHDTISGGSGACIGGQEYGGEGHCVPQPDKTG